MSCSYLDVDGENTSIQDFNQEGQKTSITGCTMSYTIVRYHTETVLKCHESKVPVQAFKARLEAFKGHAKIYFLFGNRMELSICKYTPGKINMEPTAITHLERKMIFQTSMIMFHVNLPGCIMNS